MFYKSKDLTLSINLNKPKEKWEIISCIKSVPKSTDHEDPQLWNPSTFERRSLVNTFSQPLLNCNVPMWNLVSDVFVTLNNDRTTCIDQFELFSIKTHTTCMYTCNTKFPTKVIFESYECDADKRVKQNIKCIMLKELISFHVWCWGHKLPKHINTCT